jgi:GLPGLI family protein
MAIKEMKYLLFLLFFTSFLYSQSKEDKVYSITYWNEFKDRLSANSSVGEYSRLMVNGNSSIYQIYNVMILDTLREDKKAKDSDRNKYFSFNNHTIKIINSEISYQERIFEDEYVYNETINYEWSLHDENQIVEGYNCKKATTFYGGRKWEAWYTLELPINAGPYKFKGLPGLIMKLTDSSGSYDYTFVAMIEKSLRPLEKYHHQKPESEWILVDRITFNKTKANFENLSLNEKMSYGKPGSTAKVVMVGNEDFFEMRDPKKTGKAEDYNPIEIDYKD